MDWRSTFNQLLVRLAALLGLFLPLHVLAGIEISVSDTSLPRQQEINQLTMRFAVDDILPSDVVLKDGEESVWGRLWLTLPDSETEGRDLPLAYHDAPTREKPPTPDDTADNLTERVHPTYYYVGRSREVEEEPNANGNITVYYEVAIRAYEGDLSSLDAADNKIKVRLAYRVWGGESYGGALAALTHSFARIDGVPSVAPKLEGLTALHHRLRIEMQRETAVEFTNSQGRQPVQGVVAYVLEKSATPVSLAPLAKVFKPIVAGGDGDLPAGAECEWLPDCSISCPTPDVYFAYDQVGEIPALANSILLTGNSRSIPDLKPNVVYQVILQYYPDGIARSECMEAAAIENKTLLELNGLGAAKRHDLHCFVATAAYGSRAGIVKQLRWFRDKFLLPHASGRKLVALYYEYSPPLAALISNNALLKLLAQALLLLPFALVLLLKYPLAAVALGSGVVAALVYCGGRRRRVSV